MLTANPFNDETVVPDPSPLDVIRTGTWLDSQQFPPVAWSVPGLIPEGFGLLTGAPKIGKSWAALGVGLAVAAGGKALGRIDVGKPRPTLYLALEDGERRLQSRARKLLTGESIPGLFHYATDTGLTPITHVIGAWLAEYGDRDPLVMLDTLGRVMPSARAGESAYERDYRIGADLKRLTDDHPGSTLLVVHHVRKAEGADWMDSTSGTNGLNGAADFTINLSRSRNSDDGTVRVTGRDVIEAEYAVTITDCAWVVDGDDLADAARQAETRTVTEGLGDHAAESVRHVNASSGEVTPAEVADALGMDRGKVRTYLRRAAEAGRIGNPRRGTYTPVTSVTSVTSAGQSLDVVTPSVTSGVTSPADGETKDTQVTHVTRSVGRSPSCRVCGQSILIPDGSGICARRDPEHDFARGA